MATYYRWRKSTVGYTEQKRNVAYAAVYGTNGKVYYSIGKPNEDGNGNYIFTQNITVPDRDSAELHNAWISNEGASNKARYGSDSGATIVLTGDINYVSIFADGGTLSQYTLTQGPGTSQGYVYSTSSSAYPNGGVKVGYYYDQRTTVESPTVPTGLTYPNPITTPTVMLSWDAATSNTSYDVVLYEVSYSINGGSSWVVDNTTGNTTYNFTSMPTGATSIMFRVRAWDMNGQYGNYVTGTASQVLLAPTLTVPALGMQGQPIIVNWSIIEGASSYTLQRKSSADADWVQVYSGANTTFSETVGTWTMVQYRVQAVFDGTPGGWAESAAIPVVSASSLVISGTDEDLGVVTNDIPYSISTDTGNQITATITVNNAVIFSGSVGNSTADVIPVLDLITGEGTIVISATVDASGSPVTATRTWTYEKAAITFPDSGSVAQVTKEGENIYPKVLAEGVRLPGGKTLDQVMGFPCQIYTGSYVGTGTYGADNPNTLTFPFEPKLVFVVGSDSLAGQSLAMIHPSNFAFSVVNATNQYLSITWDGNSVSYFGTSDGRQFNQAGKTYCYVALG